MKKLVPALLLALSTALPAGATRRAAGPAASGPSLQGLPADFVAAPLSLSAPAPVLEPLAALRDPALGYAVLPLEQGLTPEAWSAVEEAVRDRWRGPDEQRDFKGSWDLYDFRIASRRWAPEGRPAAAKAMAHVRAFMEGFDARMQAALAGETFRLRDVQVRLVRGQEAVGAVPHVDGSYATLTMMDPATVLYNGVQETSGRFQAPARAPVVVSNQEREELLGIPGTAHAASPGVHPERWGLIARWIYTGPLLEKGKMFLDISERVRASIRSRIASAEAVEAGYRRP